MAKIRPFPRPTSTLGFSSCPPASSRAAPAKTPIATGWCSLAELEVVPFGRALTGDSEYACKTLLRSLPEQVVFSGPLPKHAALYAPPGKRARMGRPRKKGRRLATPSLRAKSCTWQRIVIRLYGRDVPILIHTFTCLWYSVRGEHLVRVVLTRDPTGRWKDRAYFCTDPSRSPEEILAGVAKRWQLEVTFQAAKQVLGLEEPRNGWWRRMRGYPRADRRQAGPNPRGNRGRKAVERTVPLIFLTYALVVVWFHQHGNVRAAVNRQRQRKPWYGQKRHPAYVDMVAALRREFWAARLSRYPSLRPHRAKVMQLMESIAYAA